MRDPVVDLARTMQRSVTSLLTAAPRGTPCRWRRRTASSRGQDLASSGRRTIVDISAIRTRRDSCPANATSETLRLHQRRKHRGLPKTRETACQGHGWAMLDRNARCASLRAMRQTGHAGPTAAAAAAAALTAPAGAADPERHAGPSSEGRSSTATRARRSAVRRRCSLCRVRACISGPSVPQGRGGGPRGNDVSVDHRG